MVQVKNWLLIALPTLLTIAVADRAAAQTTPPAATTPAASVQTPVRRPGGLVPGQKRPPGDPAQIARGKTLYGISCTSCHGADLRGGDLGGPNLLRSQVALSDQDGELIVPIIQGARQNSGMPAVPMSPADGKAVAAYIRSEVATIGTQGKPPSIGKPAPSVLVGDATAGQAYFAAKCGSCHSPSGDLAGIATRVSDPKALQNAWVAGGTRNRRFGPTLGAPGSRRTVIATITAATGERVEGRLVRIDDFLVTVALADGTSRTFRREGDIPKVDVQDPMKIHRDLLAAYTDKDIHDVTAYLVTLK
ncbi:MAG TPA: c-type cytochrome [Bryobacteraceae bacterium]|jgi:cytochrome c oxidase cbb3-type subunit 3|nr:c-type cytochrome [Bryobacteraceae bacterium]